MYTVTIPGGTLSTDRGIRVRLFGSYLQNSGGGTAGKTLTVRVRLGTAPLGTVLYEDTTGVFAASASRRAATIDFDVFNTGTANAQKVGGVIRVGSPGAATTGTGDLTTTIGTSDGYDEAFLGTGAIDTSGDVVLVVTVAHGTANASISFRKEMASAELLK